ncbi:disease resistance protein RPM1-like [Panicum virgatum]|uniref:disease resistance protein RPM1-like n=1 Tax=Panicum virgatum TaxID=38727 RepID=UPI0019D53B68|nr:disease resistance protein RPM1-like [Panicum virgatum]
MQPQGYPRPQRSSNEAQLPPPQQPEAAPPQTPRQTRPQRAPKRLGSSPLVGHRAGGDVWWMPAVGHRPTVEVAVAVEVDISLRRAYADILKTVFPKRAKDQAISKQAAKATIGTSSTSLGHDQIREIIDKVKVEIRQELQQEYRPHKEQPEGTRGDEIIQEAVIEETKKKLEAIKRRVIHQLSIRGMVGKIKDHLKDDEGTLILMKKFLHRLVSGWEETIAALNMVAGAVFGRAEALPNRAYDKVLQLTSQQKEDNYNPRIFRDILVQCQPYDDEKFCMEIFAYALYSNPMMSNGELRKLHSSLKASPKSSASVAMQMLKFAYNDLPKEYRSCLLYLAIFPSGKNAKPIGRSTLIGRWVVEGLITKEDWPTSVREANRCFDMLIDRYLVNPDDTGLTGKAKSCRVSVQVHQFITKIAKSQHIVETRLSRHLACHFSIFNDLRLRGSDTIENFFQQLMKSEQSQLSTLKVLDLEGCRIFDKNPRYLKVVCNKLLLLKYLSLRGTDITKLPNEINKLHELEVLDIRQTKLPASATKRVVLLKLKRLLAGDKGTINHSISGMK